MYRSIAVSAVVYVLCGAGCSTLKSEQIRSRGAALESGGSISTWSSDKFSAVESRGKICIATPNRIVSLGAAGQAAAYLNAGGPAVGLGGSKAEMKGGANGALHTAAAPAVVVSESATLMNSGLFYLCQLAANGSLSEPNLIQLVDRLISTVGAVADAQIRAISRRPISFTDVQMENSTRSPSDDPATSPRNEGMLTTDQVVNAEVM